MPFHGAARKIDFVQVTGEKDTAENILARANVIEGALVPCGKKGAYKLRIRFADGEAVLEIAVRHLAYMLQQRFPPQRREVRR